ncbi:ABC transporter permease [Thermococcus eurythermalis]|uniref:ABC transporter permease n=1 Tax=Thermococcus eurythermalis TaxID=1505907 RepID=A0A097QVD4_9EURY|nr:ABC transporter permease [Thermococcus eurythermalis]AIU70428.1 ABC transporter permease [Thermococcus eurythermalis]
MNETMIISLLLGSLAAMVPIALTSIGAVISERAGVVNIGYEGILMFSAFFGAMFAELAGNGWVGLLGGALVGMLLGALHGILTVYLKGDHVIPGIGLNLLAAGAVAFGIFAYWGTAGQHQVPSNVQIEPLWMDAFGNSLSPMVPITIVIAIIAWWVLFKTPFGLRIRAVGENPEAADALGINVELYRFTAVLIASALAGIAGAYLSVDWLGTVTKTISAGRGFIALANMVFSGWNPLVALGGAFLFGFFDNLAIYIQNNPWLAGTIPWQFIATLPYVVTLVVVAGIIGKARPPKADGKPYKRE